MGQKVHPTGFRLGITTNILLISVQRNLNTQKICLKDIEVREHLTEKLAHASVSRMIIRKDS